MTRCTNGTRLNWYSMSQLSVQFQYVLISWTICMCLFWRAPFRLACTHVLHDFVWSWWMLKLQALYAYWANSITIVLIWCCSVTEPMHITISVKTVIISCHKLDSNILKTTRPSPILCHLHKLAKCILWLHFMTTLCRIKIYKPIKMCTMTWNKLQTHMWQSIFKAYLTISMISEDLFCSLIVYLSTTRPATFLPKWRVDGSLNKGII